MSQFNPLSIPHIESQKHSADNEFGEEIIAQIQRFERTLAGKFDVGVHIPGHLFFTLTAVKKWHSLPLMCFYGITEGEPIAIYQHQNQVNFSLVRSPIAQPNQPRKPIGFTTEGE